MAIDSLLNNDSNNVGLIAYADDLLILIHEDSRDRLERRAEEILEILSRWCEINKHEVSLNKTKAMMLKGEMNKSKLPVIKYRINRVKYVEEIKYLGLLIDKKLNFIKHIKYVYEKVKSICGKFRRLARAE